MADTFLRFGGSGLGPEVRGVEIRFCNPEIQSDSAPAVLVQSTGWTTNLSLHPEPGCNVTKFVPEMASRSTSPGQDDFWKEACSPPCGVYGTGI